MDANMIKDHEKIVRPMVEGKGRKVICVSGINGDTWIVRVAVPDPAKPGQLRYGQRRHETESAAVADYEDLVRKMEVA